jgi:flagellar basal body-associated protein FliL
MTYLLFGVALSLSAVAAWYAIAGLMAIFAASAIPIMIMGSLLESSKLVIASWLYRNWKEIPRLMRVYFTASLVILMLLTSMGIFGFLSKAHLDQAIPSGDVASKLALIDEKIKTEKENINASRKELTQLDAQVDQTIGRTTDDKGTERAITIRRGQQKDRARILNEIGQAQTKIAKYNEERAPIASEVRKVEAEVGPIKYIAALLYGDHPDSDVLEKAVRFVIIMIVMVFDPLAVLLLVAANWNQKHETERNEPAPVYVAEVTMPDPVEINETEIIPEPIQVEIKDEVPVSEELLVHTRPENHPVDRVITDEVDIEEELNITVEDSKDWEPNLYNRLEKRDETIPLKTQSFLNKAKEVATKPSSSVGVKTMEQEIEDLQNLKS